jgi:hypothetical protein
MVSILCKRKPCEIRGSRVSSSRSLKEPGRARRNEKTVGSCPGISPGDRGMDGGAGPPIPCQSQGWLGSFHQFLWTGSHPSRNANMELCGEARNRNRARAESGPMGVSTRRNDTVTQRGLGYYCEPARTHRSGETTSPKGSCCEAEHESGQWVRGVGECGKVRKTS